MKQRWLLGDAVAWGAAALADLPRSDHWARVGTEVPMGGRACPARDPGRPADPTATLPLQVGMPRTLSASDMVTPGSLGPPPSEPMDGEQAGQPLLDGALSSASLDTLIQHLVPTADYYPEVGDLPCREEG